MIADDATPRVDRPVEVFGPLPPQREGQYLTMTICGTGADPSERGHWESPAHVQQRIDGAVRRLRRKLEKRDEKISGLKRRIADLEHALAVKDVEAKRLPREVTRAVQEALCNVRLIPLVGLGQSARILEVKSSPG
jgi:hypothetical protein